MLAALWVQTTEEEDARRELERLLLLTGQGNREAFGLLYAKTRGAVYALALSLLGDAHEAQDIAQDAYVRVWESAPSYRPQGSPMAWLLTVARNLARSRLRQSGRQTTLDEEAWNAIPAAPPGVSPEDRQVLQEALARLDALEADHEYLVKGGVFPQRLIDIWVARKRAELKQLEQIPNPAEFKMYYDL